MIGATVVGGVDEFFNLRFGEFVDLLEEDLHFRSRGSAHDESDRLAIGPAIRLSFAHLHQVGQSDGVYGVAFVGDDGKIARGRQRGTGHEKKADITDSMVSKM